MRCHMTPRRVRRALAAIAVGLTALTVLHAAAVGPAREKEPTPVRARWASFEAVDQLKLYPDDPYLQFVALQTARREGRLGAVTPEVERIVNRGQRWAGRRGRRDRVDLFSIFTGALAVQESLQLDTMRGAAGPGRREPRAPGARKVVEVATLSGPTIKSHPWKKMLGDKKPAVGPLATRVPEDYYFIEFRSLNKMLELLDSSDLWGAHLFSQASREARTQKVGERIRKQLAVRTNRLLRPVYDAVVEEVAVTGSDLFVAEGSDVTLIFKAKKPDLLKARMDGFLSDAMRTHKDAERTEGEYLGVKYVHITTPERQVHVFSAYPEPDFHVRSNSKVAFERVLAAIKGKTPDGKPVARLGESKECRYIRTIMPRGAKEEDGFIYLSDPFIRRLVGPVVKLTERRRMLCYNHLRILGHASLLYQTEHGRKPKSLDELHEAKCLPGRFNEGRLTCPAGGTYKLSADGNHGYCTAHGHAHALIPCCEKPVNQVTGEEAAEYKRFLEEYNRYWRTYFDPIAVRVRVTPKRYRLETIVLPLIDNSIYRGLATALGGKPEPLDALPVPDRTIFSVAGRFDKEALFKGMGLNDARGRREMEQEAARTLGLPEEKVRDLDFAGFLQAGLGNQVGLHVYDAEPILDLNFPELFGLLAGNFNGRTDLGGEEVMAGFVVTSFAAPVYVSLPVQDEKVVDRFLGNLDELMARQARQPEQGGFLPVTQDFYRVRLKSGHLMRSYAVKFGPVKVRFHWARIGNGLYIASKPFILDDLAAAHAARKGGAPDPETKAHAMVRLRPKNWKRVLDDYRLSWAENNRQACLANLGPLSSVGRAVVARGGKEADAAERGKRALALGEEVYAVRFFCPEGGKYLLSADGRSCTCSIHGDALHPKQGLTPKAGAPSAMDHFGGLTATLTFLEDGLHAVVTVDRR
jgi:hypothetical protein